MKFRINRYLASCGLGSRRKCEKLVKEGRIFVNGRRISDFATMVDPACDSVTLDGDQVLPVDKTIVLAMNKPTGVLSTVADDRGRPTVIDIARKRGFDKRLYPVGRLDMDTSGLILLTNDGDLAYRLTHPRYKVEKTYRVLVEGVTDRETMQKIRSGVDIGGYVTSPCRARILKRLKDSTMVEIKISEGRKRQIRRMFSSCGHRVLELRRISIGDMLFEDLVEGDARTLTVREERHLRQLAGLI